MLIEFGKMLNLGFEGGSLCEKYATPSRLFRFFDPKFEPCE